MPLRRFSPRELVEAHNATRSGVAATTFFSPRFQKQREWYCAGHFALAYEVTVAPCAVAFQEPDHGNHIDFFLESNSGCHEFQITEVQEPGRRRGDEYRSTQGVRHVDEQEMIEAAEKGPDWISAAIQRKRGAYAGDLSRLNLLVYVNFWARGLNYERIVAAVPHQANDFGSIWLITGNLFCSLKGSALLGNVSDWRPTPAVTSEA